MSEEKAENRKAADSMTFVCLACGKFSSWLHGVSANGEQTSSADGWDDSCISSAKEIPTERVIFSPTNDRVIGLRDIVVDTGAGAAQPKPDSINQTVMGHLFDLLACIHRDTGKYTEHHGLEKSVKRAHEQLSSLMLLNEGAAGLLARLVKWVNDHEIRYQDQIGELRARLEAAEFLAREQYWEPSDR